MKKVINTLLMSGGGTKSIAYIGVLKKLEEMNTKIKIDVKTICGVSAGSIFGLVYTLKYTSEEMEKLLLNTKLEKLKNIKYINFFNKYGLDSGDKIIEWIDSMIINKGYDKNITFIELYNKTNIDFQVMTTNLNKYSSMKFNYINTPKVKVTDAIRMSISIPFVFTYNTYLNDIHVDGSIIDNFPIKDFDDLSTTLGIKLINHGELDDHNVDEKINDMEGYIYHILSCYIVQREMHVTRSDIYKNHVIFIDTEKISEMINFSLPKESIKKLIDIGYNASHEFFEKNDIEIEQI